MGGKLGLFGPMGPILGPNASGPKELMGLLILVSDVNGPRPWAQRLMTQIPFLIEAILWVLDCISFIFLLTFIRLLYSYFLQGLDYRDLIPIIPNIFFFYNLKGGWVNLCANK